MKIGFTGTQNGMSNEQYQVLESLFIRLGAAHEFHHGDCIGADAQAHIMAMRRDWRIILHPPDNKSKRAFCSGYENIRQAYPYLTRNQHIVNECDVLFATPKEWDEQQRSGTWATVRRARKKGMPICFVFPDGHTTGFDEIEKSMNCRTQGKITPGPPVTIRELGVLELDGDDTDFKLKDEAINVWIAVGNISVEIRKTDEGVIVNLLPLHREMENELGSTFAYFSEAEEESGD